MSMKNENGMRKSETELELEHAWPTSTSQFKSFVLCQQESGFANYVKDARKFENMHLRNVFDKTLLAKCFKVLTQFKQLHL